MERYTLQTIKISGIESEVVSAGPGKRTEIFIAGCERGCPGCINEWALGYPVYEMTIPEIMTSVYTYKTNRISISGGEPLLQYENLLRLMDTLTFNIRKCEILLYTGYTFEEYLRRFNGASEYITYLVPGSFRQELAYTKIEDSFVGSKNQPLLRYLGNDIWKRIPLDQYGRIKETNE